MFIKRVDYEDLKQVKNAYTQLKEDNDKLSEKCDRLTLEHLSMYNALYIYKAEDKLYDRDFLNKTKRLASELTQLVNSGLMVKDICERMKSIAWTLDHMIESDEDE